MAMSTILVKSFQVTALASALALVGCGSGGNDTLPPKSNGNTNTNTNGNASTQKVDVSSITITKSFGKFSLAQDAKFSITANAINNGRGVAGAIIDFTLPNPSETGIYTVSAIPATTNESGEAVIELQVKDIAKAKKYLAEYPNGLNIQASPTNASSSVNAGTINLTGQQPSTSTNSTLADVNKVSIITDTNTLTGEAGQTVKITAQIRDKDNNALANLPVTFSIDDTNATGVIAKSALTNVMTNNNGEATLQLETSALSAEQLYYLQTSGLTVKASSGTDNSVFKEIKIKTQEVAPASRAESLLLSAEFNQIKAEAGNKVKITATVIDKNGAIVANAPVSLSGLAGTGLINNTGAVVNTDETGQAVFELEIKDVAKATTALSNPVTLTAQSGATAVGTTTLRGAPSNADTEAYKLFVSPSKQTLTTASDSSTLTIRVTDVDGGIKADVPVQLQMVEGIDKGLTFSKTSSLKTDQNGVVTVDLVQSDIGLVSKLEHTAKVKVTVNDGVYQPASQEITFTITGTKVINPTVSKTSLSDDESVVLGGKLVTGQVVNNAETPITNTQVELINTANPNTVIATATTNGSGEYSFNQLVSSLGVTDSNSKLNLALRLRDTATSTQQVFDGLYTLTKITPTNTTLSVAQKVNGKDYGQDNEVLVNRDATITLNVPSIPNDGIAYISTTKGSLKSDGQNGTRIPVTVNSGKATVTINSNSSGTATIKVENSQALELLSEQMSFISKDVKELLLNSDITIVNTNGEATLTATVKDSAGIPVKNAVVEFSLVRDASGGRIGSSYALTDENGLATVSYFSGKNPTKLNDVQIRSTVKAVRVGNTEEVVNIVNKDLSLTVQNRAPTIGVSFSNKLDTTTNDPVYYYRDASIYVVNSTGKPAVNQPVSISIVPDSYRGGQYVATKDAEGKDVWGIAYYPYFQDFKTQLIGNAPLRLMTRESEITCKPEDTNGNNIVDGKEDTNGNGKLDPFNPVTILSRNSDPVALANDGTTKLVTDATGKLDFKIRYPKDTAEWFTAKVFVTTQVEGTESSHQLDKLDFPVSVADVTDFTIRPNPKSPFAYRNVIKVQNGTCMIPQQ